MAVTVECPLCHKSIQLAEDRAAVGGSRCPGCGAMLPAGAGGASALGPETLKAAMKAFRKRLKLAQLDEESTIGHGPFSLGGKSDIFAVRPPNQFPQAVWDELIRKGVLRRAAAGLLELAPPTPGKKG